MIQANELRIGNWVNESYWNGEEQVEQAVQLAKIEGSFDNCNPIPLTPEILQKAGFTEQHDTYNWSIGYCFQTNGHFTLISRNDTFYYIDAINLEINYLHQLQNLYFALTGEELQIEL